LPDSLLGSGWYTMHTYLSVPLSYMGIISMIISGGTIISSIFSERITRLITVKYVTLISVALTAVALIGFSFSSVFWQLCLWAVPYGLGAGAVDAALNAYVAEHYSSRHMNWLHCFWGVGAIVSPYIMSYAVSVSRWQSGYRIVSIIQFCVVAILAISLPLWKINKSGTDGECTGKHSGFRGVVKIKGVSFLLVGFFAYCAAEATSMLWASSYLVSARGFSEERGAAFASLFYIGIAVGRFISGFIANKIGDKGMIRLGTGIILVGIVFVAVYEESGLLALIGFTVTGFGCGPIYPSIVHSTPDRFGTENAQTIMGIQMACAYIGSTFMPPLFGVLSGATTLAIMPYYILFFIALMTVMLEISNRKTLKITLLEE